MMLVGSIVLCCVLLSAVSTHWVRAYALKRDMLDRPSARGLHEAAVARGGGAAILAVVSAGLIALIAAGSLAPRLGLPWIACGLGFGLLGWVDDRFDLSAAIRFIWQLLIAVVFCLTLPGVGPLDPVGLLSVTCGVVAMVWMVNLYNFMDGADGLAALEAVVVAGAGAAIVGTAGGADVAPIAALVAGGSAGFLYWNWSPARIFMGDVGSYFLGFQFGALLLHGAITGTGSGASVWLILLAPFVTDASLTLIRRLVGRERWWQPHRTHAYQRLILTGWSPTRVCVALLAITILLLVPAAAVAARYPPLGLSVTAMIYLLAAIIWTAIDRKTRQRA